jgi:hypothetical protein
MANYAGGGGRGCGHMLASEREASRGEVGANGAGDYDRNISFSEK